MNPLERLRHHVTGAIERGEAQAIVCQPVTRYQFQLGRWYISDDSGLSWIRTRYSVSDARKPEYRTRNPKIDLFRAGGVYVVSTNYHATCQDAFAWYARMHPETGVAYCQRDSRRR